MKNKILIFLLYFFFFQSNLFAKDLEVNATKINLDSNTKIMTLEGSVTAVDKKNNKIFTDYAVYQKNQGLLQTSGLSKLITSENYILTGSDLSFDEKNQIISSSNRAKIIDNDGNQFYLEMFSYVIKKKQFFSKGNTKLIDVKNNEYEFSEIYIDEKNNKIMGSDVKVYLNDPEYKIKKGNEPRFFANNIVKNKNISEFNKGVFTYCKNREDKKCPPWIIQSEKIKHNNSKKTIYYENAVLKIYDFPIFYFPKFSHPDPTVKRKSGLLAPSFTSNKSLGSGIEIPYFWAISKERDLTISPKLYQDENPLLLAEYRQDFMKSFLIVDGGLTEGYKNTSKIKTNGSRTHLFSKFGINFVNEEEKISKLEFNLQNVSNDTYLKVHDINSILANKNMDILENSLTYDYQDKDLFFATSFSAFEDLTKENNAKFEYLFPSATFDKNLISDDKYGAFDLSSNFKVRNYEVNKQTEIFVNDIDWKSKKIVNKYGLENQLLGKLKTVNYKARKASEFKQEKFQSQLSGAVGYLSKFGMFKNDFKNKNNYLFTPKSLVRYSPGHMRRINTGRLRYSNLFDIKKTDEIDVIENGLSTSLGFEFKKNDLNEDGTIGAENLNFEIGQVINMEENPDNSSSTSLDQRFSDVVGGTSFSMNDNFKISYNFALDQNYKDLNYNDINADIIMDKVEFSIGYLEESAHIGNQEYINSSIKFNIDESSQLNISTKRDLKKNSSEFYNISYDYMNDCLKAGLVFRREFYTDRDVQPNNSLMFRISIVPFADLYTPIQN